LAEYEVDTRLKTPWIVWLIVGAIAAAYVAYMFAPRDAQNAADFMFALIPERFHQESVYRFHAWYEPLGPIFGHALLHVAWWHAAVNGFFLFVTARYPATVLGSWRFLALVLIATAGSAIAFLAINWNDQAIAVGASGALCGVFSAYFLSARRTWMESLRDPQVRNQFAVIFILNVVVMGALSELGVFPIAWEGHLGGFVGGALGWILLAPKPRMGPWD